MHKIFLTAILTVCSLLTLGQQKPLDSQSIQKLRAGVRESALKTNTIISNFTQVKEMSILQEKINSSGKFYFRKERQLRWEYTRPYNYLVVISNDQIAIRDDQKTNRFNMQSSKVFMEINNIILGSIRGTLLNDEKNFRTAFFDSPGNYVVRLTPLSPKLKEALSSITIWFSKTDFTVNQTEMLEASGDITKITFTDKQLNRQIPDETFVIK